MSEWKAYQLSRQIAAMWWPLRKTHEPYYRNAVATTKMFRRGYAPVAPEKRLNTLDVAIQTAVKETYNNMTNSGFSRMNIDVKVGKVAGEKKKLPGFNTRTIHTVTVGWMWKRDVKKALYDRGFNSPLFLVLSAKQVAVNYKHGNLYECKVYWKTDGNVDSLFIGEKTLGKRAWVHGQTASLTVRKLVSLVDKEITKKLAGESND